jgi:hypothetical protein
LHGHSPKKGGNFALELKSGMNIHGLSDKNSVLLKLYKFGVKVFGIFVNYLYFPEEYGTGYRNNYVKRQDNGSAVRVGWIRNDSVC